MNMNVEEELLDIYDSLMDISKYDFTPNCRKCDHAYFVYGVELNCELLNKNKKCRFKEKIDEK